MFNLKDYFNSFSRYKNIYKNPIKIIWYVYNSKFPFLASLKNGRTLEIPNSAFAWIVSFGLDVSYDYRSHILSLNFCGSCLKFFGTEMNGEIPEVFGLDDYGKINFKDETVVDVGANIGDSSIYFVSKGASRVIAIEPFPSSYSLLERNISLNEMEDIILPINAALGGSDGTVNLDPMIQSTTGLGINDSKRGQQVRIISLNTLVCEFNVENSILKLDCEGCEYKVINSSSLEALSQFKALIIEFHHGVRDLCNDIKDVFDVKVIPKSGKLGLITAIRKLP
ncbi:MAG: FkbM family methyltransferase [Thermoplasmataceae archaeon]